MTEDVLRNLLEAKAKEAYGVYAYRAGGNSAFEHLPACEMQAWRDVVSAMNADAECDACGDTLKCPVCDPEEDDEIFPECEFCFGPLVCPICDAEDANPAAGQHRLGDGLGGGSTPGGESVATHKNPQFPGGEQ